MKREKMVYSVVSTDVTTDWPVDTQVVGSYRRREDAVTACVDYIMERLALRPDIKYAFMNDVNHSAMKEIAKMSKVTPGRLKRMFAYQMDEWEIPKEVEPAVRSFALEVAKGGVYDMCTDMESDIGSEQFVFEIQENALQ